MGGTSTPAPNREAGCSWALLAGLFPRMEGRPGMNTTHAPASRFDKTRFGSTVTGTVICKKIYPWRDSHSFPHRSQRPAIESGMRNCPVKRVRRKRQLRYSATNRLLRLTNTSPMALRHGLSNTNPINIVPCLHRNHPFTPAKLQLPAKSTPPHVVDLQSLFATFLRICLQGVSFQVGSTQNQIHCWF